MSWQAQFKERACRIVADLAKRYEIEVLSIEEHRRDDPDLAGLAALAAKMSDGTRRIWIPEIRSHVTLAIALHEIGHIVLGHCDKGARKHSALRELEAWGYAYAVFAENRISWTQAVRVQVRSILLAHVNEILTEQERATLPATVETLVKLL